MIEWVHHCSKDLMPESTVESPDDIVSTYQCHFCGKWYGRRRVEIHCLVYHSPGQCCHYREPEVKPPEEVAA